MGHAPPRRGSTGLRRPGSEQFAVPLDQSLALERRKWLVDLIPVCFPHVSNGLRIGSCKTPQEGRVVAEMTNSSSA